MKPFLPIASLAALSLALAACQGEQTAQQGTAEGEILPGSASDAMLPYDTVRSRPPLAPMPTGSGKPSAKRGGEADAKAGTEDEAAAVASPGEPQAEEMPAE